MTRKYDLIDEQLLQWLRENPQGATTSAIFKALNITCTTAQRHISRRVTNLSDRGILTCVMQGASRVCEVNVSQLPKVLHKGGPNNKTWRSRISGDTQDTNPTTTAPSSAQTASIPADNSLEFEAAGGIIQRLPCVWERPHSRRQMGPVTPLDHVLDSD